MKCPFSWLLQVKFKDQHPFAIGSVSPNVFAKKYHPCQLSLTLPCAVVCFGTSTVRWWLVRYVVFPSTNVFLVCCTHHGSIANFQVLYPTLKFGSVAFCKPSHAVLSTRTSHTASNKCKSFVPIVLAVTPLGGI